MHNTFLKKQRLLNKSDFQGLRTGSRFFAFGVFVFYVKENNLERNRIGIAVSKKFGKANTRNKFKRKIREYFRVNHSKIEGSYDILVAPNFRTIKRKKFEVNEVFNQFELDLKKSFLCGFKK